MRDHRHLTDEQLAALLDAYRSLNYGGLEEVAGDIGTVWVGAHPELTTEHRNSTVHVLFAAGLLNRTGRKPMREAEITEAGLLELDMAGVAA